MAYADILRLTTADFDDVATLMEGLLVDYGQVNQGGSRTTTSSSMADISGMSVPVTVEAGDRVEIIAGYLFSHSVQYNTAGFQLVRNSTNLGSDQACRALRANVDGADLLIAEAYIDNPGAGAHTYKVQWNTNAATLYTVRQWMTVKVLRYS